MECLYRAVFKSGSAQNRLVPRGELNNCGFRGLKCGLLLPCEDIVTFPIYRLREKRIDSSVC